jgi:hypothetical protein
MNDLLLNRIVIADPNSILESNYAIKERELVQAVLGCRQFG